MGNVDPAYTDAEEACDKCLRELGDILGVDALEFFKAYAEGLDVPKERKPYQVTEIDRKLVVRYEAATGRLAKKKVLSDIAKDENYPTVKTVGSAKAKIFRARRHMMEYAFKDFIDRQD